MNKNNPDGYIIIFKSESCSDPDPRFRSTYQEAVNAVNDYFLGYDFEIKNNRAYDPGHADNEEDLDEEPFECFEDVVMHEGKIAEFKHCPPDGPEAKIYKNKYN